MSIDYEKIKRLIALMEQNQLTELSVEEDGFTITIKAEQPQPAHAPQPTLHAEAQPIEMAMGPLVEPEEEVVEEEAPAGNLEEIRSPMIGVFYRKPAHDAPPFIEVGAQIEDGQTIGLIEAMKVFSEVPSEIAGRVVELRAENGKLVQAGDVLVVVDISEAQ